MENKIKFKSFGWGLSALLFIAGCEGEPSPDGVFGEKEQALQLWNKSVAVYKFKPGEMFLVSGNRMVKIRNAGGTGQNAFALCDFSGEITSVEGYDYYLGDQAFAAKITDVDYIGGQTLIALASGKMLKVVGTGGTGHNMFAVTETSSGFQTVPGYSYFVGAQKFGAGVRDVSYAQAHNVTFISLTDGRMLKVTGTGGSGQNMFAVTETATGFETVPGYNYRLGDQHFSSFVTDVDFIGGYTFVSLANGKMLKSNGVGGTGHNMFAITENASGFAGIPGYNYRVGTQVFSAYIVDVTYIPAHNVTFISLADGRMLKVNGAGGSGYNMFAVTETPTGFESVPGYAYRLGDQYFSTYVTDLDYVGGYTFVSLANGKMLKSNGTGGAGHNLFAVTENASGFAGVPGYNYRVGAQNLGVKVDDVTYIAEQNALFVSLAGTGVLKIQGTGGSGYNMFAVTEIGGLFTGLPGYNYYLGYQDFPLADCYNCSIPPYDPGYWNGWFSGQKKNNCYNYANNVKTNTFAQPGRASGTFCTFSSCMNAATISLYSQNDGIEPLPPGQECGGNEDLLALVIAPGIDYHWYRQDSNGMWSHKPGQTKATNVDNSGNTIGNPETADRGIYTVFAGYFCSCSDEEQGQGHEIIE